MYSGIDDMPILIWWQFSEKRDVTLLLKEPRKVNRFEAVALANRWTKTFDQYIQEFGFSEIYERILQLQLENVKNYAKKFRTGDRSLQTFININNEEIKELQERTKNQNNSNHYETLGMVQKFFGGMHIDIRTCSVRQYMSYIRTIEKQVA